MSQIPLFDENAGKLLARRHQDEDGDVKPPKDAEEKAARWAAQLVDEEGWDPEAAELRARAAYGLTLRRPTGRPGLGDDFRKAALEQIASERKE